VLDLGLWIAKIVKRLNGDPGPVGWEQGSFRAGAPEPTDLAGPGRCLPPLLLPSYLTAKGRHGSSNRRVIVGECVPSRGSTRDGNGSGSEDLKLRRPGQLRNMISPASSYVQDLFGRLLTRRMCALHDSTKSSQDSPPGYIHPPTPSELERKFQVSISPAPLHARLHYAGNRWPLVSAVASARPIENLDRAVVWPSLADSGPFPDLLVVWVFWDPDGWGMADGHAHSVPLQGSPISRGQLSANRLRGAALPARLTPSRFLSARRAGALSHRGQALHDRLQLNRDGGAFLSTSLWE
jgi:hypothetical protein